MGAVATLTFNRKLRYNQLSDDMMDAMLDALVELHNSVGKVRVVVVRASAPGLPLCAGMDVEEAKDDGKQDLEDLTKSSRNSAYIYYLWSTLPQYVIGMVTGPCMGSGIALCCTMDLAICLNKPFVFFDFAETRMGMICVSWIHVVAKIGAQKARMAICQGMKATPMEAKELGILHHLCNEKDEMEGILKQVIENCNTTAPGAVAHAKHYLADLSGNAPTLEKLHWTADQMTTRIQSEEKCHAGECFANNQEKPSWEKEKLQVPKPLH